MWAFFSGGAGITVIAGTARIAGEALKTGFSRTSGTSWVAIHTINSWGALSARISIRTIGTRTAIISGRTLSARWSNWTFFAGGAGGSLNTSITGSSILASISGRTGSSIIAFRATWTCLAISSISARITGRTGW